MGRLTTELPMLAIAAAFFCLFASMVHADESPSKQAEALCKKAEEAMAADEYAKAISICREALKLDPGCGLKHGIYAVRAGVGGKLHDAVASFGRRPTFDNGAPLLEVFSFVLLTDTPLCRTHGGALDAEFE